MLLFLFCESRYGRGPGPGRAPRDELPTSYCKPARYSSFFSLPHSPAQSIPIWEDLVAEGPGQKSRALNALRRRRNSYPSSTTGHDEGSTCYPLLQFGKPATSSREFSGCLVPHRLSFQKEALRSVPFCLIVVPRGRI